MKKFILLLILFFPFRVNAINYIVMDSDNNRVIAGEGIHNKSLIASITKIMTSIIVIENSNINENIKIDDNVLKSFGSGIYIKPGEVISIKDLLYGLMLRSGNDAAIALAYKVGGDINKFANMMNNMASKLGMSNSVFYNPHGLEDDYGENISTLYDMALLSSYAINNDTYKMIVGTKNHKVKTNMNYYDWYNKNKLLSMYKYCIGGKTGYTMKAKRTLVTNASKDNVNFTIVTFRDGNDFNDHMELYEKYFKIYKNYTILKKGYIETKYDNSYISNDIKMSLTKEEFKKINNSVIYYSDNVTEKVGYVSVKLGDKEYYREDILIKKEKDEEISFWDKFKDWIKSLW